MKRINRDDLALIRERIAAGMTKGEAYKLSGFTPNTIRSFASKVDIGGTNSNAVEEIRKRKHQIETGQISMLRLARELGVSEGYVSTICKREGINAFYKFAQGRRPGTKDDEVEVVIEHLKERGGYVPEIIRDLGIDIAPWTVRRYARKHGINLGDYRYSNQMYGHWRCLPGNIVKQGKANYIISAECTLCNTVHRVGITNIKGGYSTCCKNCAAKERRHIKIKCTETGERFRSIRTFAKSFGLMGVYQRIRRSLNIDGYYMHEGKRYEAI